MVFREGWFRGADEARMKLASAWIWFGVDEGLIHPLRQLVYSGLSRNQIRFRKLF